MDASISEILLGVGIAVAFLAAAVAFAFWPRKPKPSARPSGSHSVPRQHYDSTGDGGGSD
ncbi:MAG: hypothetical protein AB8B51_02015 [Sedimentitalea sp.]